MHRRIDKAKKYVYGVIAAEAIVLLICTFSLNMNCFISILILGGELAAAVYLFDMFVKIADEHSLGVETSLGSAAKEAFLLGGVGMIKYDENYEIIWMSELFEENNSARIGQKVLSWIPEADDLIAGKADSAEVMLDGHTYMMWRKEDEPVIFFRDITERRKFKQLYDRERIVIGLANFDNYEESTQYEDESDVSAINTAVRNPLTDYCHEHQILARRLSNSKYLLVLNEQTLSELNKEHFSVLTKVRKAAQSKDVSITLSMAFAHGTSDLEELDRMAANLMDLAQTRGGDQVAMQLKGEEVQYYGGSSEAAEKRSRVRVRVMAHALRDLIMKSGNVIICGHKTADFDCIGSAVCLARICTALHKNVVIIAKTGGVEEKLSAVLASHAAELKPRVTFVTESEALNQLNDNSLVIMTDHHNVRQSNGAKVLENARKVVVIDHHRRSTEMGVKPVLMYIEAGASSTCELLTEMTPFISTNIDINELEANIMLAGIIVDTQNMRVRTGARTYGAAASLRELGGDPQIVYSYLKDTYDEFALKSAVAGCSERYEHGVIVADVTDRLMTRSLMSQVADSMLNIQDVQAVFVIANTSDTETAVSARSAGRINVQTIMEKMKGGGHRTAAAMQRTKTSVEAVKKELLTMVDEYFKEEDIDESDS